MDIVTRKVERITYNPASDFQPDWCPKGERIAFISKRDSRNGDLYIVDTLKKETLRITKNMWMSGFDDIEWTPDGNKLAFSSSFGGKYAIYLINPYGKVPVSSPNECEVIVGNPPPDTDHFRGFSFSPDQTMISFAAYNDSFHDIYTMDLSKGDFKNLTHNSFSDDESPCWSPDGKFIAFSSYREGSIGGSDIYFITPEGKIIKQLKLSGYDLNPDIFDPDFTYSLSPLDNSKASIWGEIKR